MPLLQELYLDRLRRTRLDARRALRAFGNVPGMGVELFGARIDARMAIDSLAAQALRLVDTRTQRAIRVRDERGERANRADLRAPLPQHRELLDKDNRKDDERPRRLVELEQVPKADKRRERQTDGAHQAEHGESEHGS